MVVVVVRLHRRARQIATTKGELVDGFIIFILWVLGLAAAAALFVLAILMVVWNVTDIQNVGLNFWNTFWLGLVAVAFFGSTSAASK